VTFKHRPVYSIYSVLVALTGYLKKTLTLQAA